MPKNLKEEVSFTAFMASFMVLGMTVYNIILHNGINMNSLIDGLRGYPLALLTALILDIILIGPIVKKIVLSYADRKQLKNIKMVGLSISILMVLGMVSFMSIFGMLMSPIPESNLGWTYIKTWSLNFIVAMPLQLLIVGPFARKVLSVIQKS